LTQPSALSNFLRAHGAALLVLGVLVLLPVRRSFEAPFAIGAIIGLILAWRRRHELLALPGIRLTAVLFGCYWLPALISAPDSVAAPISWHSVGDFLRFLPFAAFACLALRDAKAWPRIVDAVSAVVVLWLLDAWVQVFTGYSISGVAETERLTGIFGAGNPKLGPVLAVLAPFVLTAARESFGRRGLIVAFALLLVPVLLAGSRAAWIMYALVVAVFVWREARSPLRFVGWSIAATAIVTLAAVVALHDSASFNKRVDRTLLALQGSEHAVDEAAAGRLRIWGTAWRMIQAHPINGVGVRAFRHAYPQYAQADDAFINRATDEGAYHAHNLVLEVLTETGTIGLAFWIAGVIVAVRAWLRANAAARLRAFAPGLALAAMLFPLNGYFAFYSADWGLFLWWLLALYCAALNMSDAEAAHAA
jgi:O-antigen ligase